MELTSDNWCRRW